jgi:hypothetical protein
MRAPGGRRPSRQICSASSSSTWTVTQSRSAVEAEHLGVELPRPRDRLGLEVVAEAEVAEHLEEAHVAQRPPDGVEVVVLPAGAHALLHRGHPPVRRRLLAEEVGDELHHPEFVNIGRRGVVRDEPGRGHLDVARAR